MADIREQGIKEANRLKELWFKKQGKLFRFSDRAFGLGQPKDLEDRVREMEDINASIIEFRKLLYSPTVAAPNSLMARKEEAERNLKISLSLKDYFK